jgi:hypothetical protein
MEEIKSEDDNKSISSSISSMGDSDDFHDKISIRSRSDVENEAAGIISNVMQSEGAATNITKLLLDRVELIRSMTWLGSHIPNCVLRDLTMETMETMETMRMQNESSNIGGITTSNHNEKQEEPEMKIPYSQDYEAAMLFVDISGFTKLSQLLDLESLSKVCCVVVLLCCL